MSARKVLVIGNGDWYWQIERWSERRKLWGIFLGGFGGAMFEAMDIDRASDARVNALE